MKNMEKLSSQVLELKGKESRLIERLEQQEKKLAEEVSQAKQRRQDETEHYEAKFTSLESKIEGLENDNKKKQSQLFAGN